MINNSYIQKKLAKVIETFDISEDHQQSLKNRITLGNKISLRKRLKQLINELEN